MWLGKEKEEERKRKEGIHITHSNLVWISSAVEITLTYSGQDVFQNEVDEGLLVF